MFAFIPILLVYLGLNYFIGWNGSLLLSYYGNPVPQGVYWTLFALMVFAYLLGRSPFPGGPAGRALKWIGSYYFAFMEFAVIVLPLADLSLWLAKRNGGNPDVYVPVISSLTLLIFVALLIRGSWNAWNPVVRKYEIEVDKQAGNLKQLRIAVASDLHLGDIVDNRHLGRLVSIVKEMKPDLVLLPGDVIDDVVEPFIRKNMIEQLKQLTPKYGIYAVLGNHEYYGGHINRYTKHMKENGIPVLQDETVLIDNSFYVAGRKDKTAQSMDPAGRLSQAELLSGLDHSKPIVLMDHQPYQFQEAADAGADLMLSGHTHRGQFAPNHWVTRRLFELDWGYLRKHNMHVIVSSGFGTWGPPIRLASRSEIVEVKVIFKK
ncbi:metallophosphoesterase [Paenibacillus gansuensis]|uniref:Metallophosphoesterase n=1 Tax=Paenibacillus gansuensis TaxID=306542 RepID=A0ABW5P814_9BACL